MGTTTLIKSQASPAGAEQKVYRLDPPLKGRDFDEEHEYVTVSAVVAMFSGPETYIFPSTSEGEITDWGELPGSYKGGMNHEEALSNAGYEVSK